MYRQAPKTASGKSDFIGPYAEVAYLIHPFNQWEFALSQLAGVRIVLVEPASSGNIGSVARVMKNTGIGQLTLVNPRFDWDVDETRALAHGAGEILDGAVRADDLQSAVADCHLVVGTTHRDGRQRDAIHPPERIVEKIAPQLPNGTVAIVFGREKDGLWQEELRLCRYLVRFPSAVSHPSYNLSHAVLLFAYALFCSTQTAPNPPSPSPAVPHAERERLFDTLEKALQSIGFVHYNRDPQHFMDAVRRFFNKIDLGERDVRVVLKICQQIQRFSRRQRSVREDRSANG